MTYNLRNIFFTVFKSFFIRSYIDSNSKNIQIGVFFSKLPFRLFLNLFGSFYIIKKVCKLRFLSLKLDFFNFKFFYNDILSLYLGHNDINKIIVLLDLVIYFLNIRSRLKIYFGFSFNHFFNQQFLDI